MKTLLPGLLLALFLCGCKKESDNAIRIGGYLLRDQYGQPMGSDGDSSDDWQLSHWSSFSGMEQRLLIFGDTVRLEHTAVAPLQPVMAYPNPVATRSVLRFLASDSVAVKVALVDAQGTTYHTYAGRFIGPHHVAFDVSDRSRFPSGKGLRYYYSFSAAGSPNFKAGYGDIKIQ